MAILNKLTSIFPAFSGGPEYYTLLAQNVPINASTTFAFTGFLNFIRCGRVRFKTTATGGAGSQVTGVKITGTDGTNTVTLYQDTVARTAAEFLDLLFDFISDLNLTTINLIITTANAGGAATADIELAGSA